MADNSEHLTKEFKDWLKNYHENLKTKNQELKSLLLERQQRNTTLKAKIEQHINNTLDSTTMTMAVVPNEAQNLIRDAGKKLKTKSAQLKKCGETIDAKLEEEIKKIRKIYYEVITKDDITLKPYYEVEAAIKDLERQTDFLKQQMNEEMEFYKKHQQKREQDFIEINEIVSVLVPIEKEIRFKIQTAGNTLTEKLKSLNLQSVEEATVESFESKELLKEISNLKLELNMQ